MSLTELKTLRSRATDKEMLEKRGEALSRPPLEFTPTEFNALSAGCKTDLDPLYPLPLVNGKRVLSTPVTSLDPEDLYRILECVGRPNGIKLVFVSIPAIPGNEAILEVEFFNRNYLQKIITKYNTDLATDPQAAARIFSISGGHRLRGGAAAGQVQVVKIDSSLFDDPGFIRPTTLVLTVKPIGDYSSYTLSINTNELPDVGPVVFPPANSVIIDPLFNEI